MHKELFSIGNTARRSGLSVSALRFYDRVEMLTPVRVDASSGYRWYSPDQIKKAELIANLRRVGLALPEISEILANYGDATVLRKILDAHVTRLEQGLASAKSMISQIEFFWEEPTKESRNHKIKVDSYELLNALNSVRFAVGHDEDFPALHGILLEAVGGNLRLTATDRYRAAFYTVETDSMIVGFRAVLATQNLGDLLEFLETGGTADLTLGVQLRVTLNGQTMPCDLLDVEFPDLDHVISASTTASRAEVDREWLRQVLGGDPEAEQWMIEIDSSGQLVLESDEKSATAEAAALQASYLAQAIEAAGGEQLRLELNGPIAPLAIRRTDNPNSFSVLMPRRRDQP